MKSNTIEELEQEVQNVEKEMNGVDVEIAKWKKRLVELHEKKKVLKKRIDQIKSNNLSSKDWTGTDYAWSQDVQDTLRNVFKIESFRPHQLSVINSTLSGEHTLVVMPTGAGKSLCYQLPALVKPGITVVISPLVSLMEDQVRNLKDRDIPSILMSSSSLNEDKHMALNALTDKKTPIKLLYVTPERLAKSKKFMANLQKCYKEGRLQRIAIDEVHCCSSWGHDFRPDYKYLGILTNIFPNLPILGLTATATSHVLTDVQKILNISGCLIIKSSFNRPNLFYQVLEKPTSQEDCVILVETLLKHRYKGKSGIIYSYSIKDAEVLANELRKRKLKVGCYHANMEPDARSKVHMKWHTGDYQAIVATIAFGMGIDKPNVRFVIHHTISKSMENYYQESGRAGRDGLAAECVILYRMQDIFKISSMVITSVENKDLLYGMIKYCLNANLCRRKLIAEYFDENWGDVDCNAMCDICSNTNTMKKINLELHCKTLESIITNAEKQQTKLTAQKLLDAWFLKGPVTLRHDGIPPRMSRKVAEDVIAYLLINGYLEEDFHFTAYASIVYIKNGPNMQLIKDPDFNLRMSVPQYHSVTFDMKKTDWMAECDNVNKESKTDTRTSNGEPLAKKSKVIIID